MKACEVRTYRDGSVVAIGEPAPTDLMAAPRLIAVNNLGDVAKLTTPDILDFARQGIAYVCNSLVVARAVLCELSLAGATV